MAAAPPGARRVAVVTGAGRGIGAATVAALVADGLSVVAVDSCADDPAVGYPLSRPEDLDALAARWPRQVVTVIADVRDPDAVRGAVDVARERFGGLDVAVAAAAVVAGGQPLWQTPAAQVHALLDVDVLGVLHLVQAAVPVMLERPAPRQGRVVALASAAAHTGLWHLAAYCAAKHAVLGLVRGLAADLVGTGVTATAVSPGSTATPMLRATADLYGLAGDAGLTQLAERQGGRVLDTAEVAATVAWLCSPAASAVTGTVVHADGGFAG
ncbi:mycofactocin-coupled SDR family oxidoreductase [Aquipuribacter sp. MA13-6]|uniref:mycofactocin-coupled SDR family oxidoreductase n=1 Tax=unclassified Aquipuribacter TaxID=2635084 RepID=UPI003EEA30F5